MLLLYVEAPFAAFRPMVCNYYRPTAPFMTHSSAYGLVLNIAGIDYRGDVNELATPVDLAKALSFKLAIGAKFPLPQVQTNLQQSHYYAAATSSERQRRYKYNKDSIRPVRWEFLSGLKAVVAIDGNEEVETRVREGLEGKWERYGVPFAGDSNFTFNYLNEVDSLAGHWYCKFDGTMKVTAKANYLCSTLWIDRANSENTVSEVFVLQESERVPDDAWVILPPKSSTPVVSRGKKR